MRRLRPRRDRIGARAADAGRRDEVPKMLVFSTSGARRARRPRPPGARTRYRPAAKIRSTGDVPSARVRLNDLDAGSMLRFIEVVVVTRTVGRCGHSSSAPNVRREANRRRRGSRVTRSGARAGWRSRPRRCLHPPKGTVVWLRLSRPAISRTPRAGASRSRPGNRCRRRGYFGSRSAFVERERATCHRFAA